MDEECTVVPPAPSLWSILRPAFPVHRHGVLPWKQGEYTPRVIYDRDNAVVGMMDTPELAEAIVSVVNALPEHDEF